MERKQSVNVDEWDAASRVKTHVEFVDESVEKTRRGKDDRVFDEQRKRDRAKKTGPPTVMPDGPCCGRCQHWLRPPKGEVFGRCRVGFVQFPGNKNTMRFVSLREVEEGRLHGVVENRTSIGFEGCSLYEEAA